MSTRQEIADLLAKKSKPLEETKTADSLIFNEEAVSILTEDAIAYSNGIETIDKSAIDPVRTYLLAVNESIKLLSDVINNENLGVTQISSSDNTTEVTTLVEKERLKESVNQKNAKTLTDMSKLKKKEKKGKKKDYSAVVLLSSIALGMYLSKKEEFDTYLKEKWDKLHSWFSSWFELDTWTKLITDSMDWINEAFGTKDTTPETPDIGKKDIENNNDAVKGSPETETASLNTESHKSVNDSISSNTESHKNINDSTIAMETSQMPVDNKLKELSTFSEKSVKAVTEDSVPTASKEAVIAINPELSKYTDSKSSTKSENTTLSTSNTSSTTQKSTQSEETLVNNNVSMKTMKTKKTVIISPSLNTLNRKR